MASNRRKADHPYATLDWLW